ALAMQLLREQGIQVKARVHSVAGIQDGPMDMVRPDLDAISGGRLPCVDPDAAARMAEAIEAARADGDSVGGVVECFATGVPAGLGAPMFDGVENRLARALFGIPAVRGVEFGLGFEAAKLRGSQHNDAFRMENGRVVTDTNRHGGALGGITSGMPLAVRVAFKPTPSIAQAQHSISLSRREDAPLAIHGRHDPCVVPRAVPVVEAAVACVVYDMMLGEDERK
ncbi:MAG: chorismate synthase, partial [Clostridia bacterium]|nr:chorismate synthase [Clostridia bacterium]